MMGGGEVFSLEEYGVLNKAIRKWGKDAQVDMAIEELAELIIALQHYKRGRNNIGDVKEELADVRIMYEQLAMFTDKADIEGRIIQRKMTRLHDRVNNGPDEYGVSFEDEE